jgi:hypothetical protein
MGAGRDMVGALGAEVDRLETEIQQVMPSIRHIDLVSTCSLSHLVDCITQNHCPYRQGGCTAYKQVDDHSDSLILH